MTELEQEMAGLDVSALFNKTLAKAEKYHDRDMKFLRIYRALEIDVICKITFAVSILLVIASMVAYEYYNTFLITVFDVAIIAAIVSMLVLLTFRVMRDIARERLVVWWLSERLKQLEESKHNAYIRI